MNTPQKSIGFHSFIMGGASAINLLAGVLKNKIAALLVGPAGFGELAYFQSTIVLLSTVFGLGTNNSGVRQIAQKSESAAEELSESIAAVNTITLVLAVIGSALAYFLACDVLKSCGSDSTRESFFVALGVFLSVLLAGKMAVLVGVGLVKEVALTSVIGATLGGLLGVIALLEEFRELQFLYILAPIAVSLACANYAVSRAIYGKAGASDVIRGVKRIVVSGIPYAATAILATSVMFGVNYLAVEYTGFEGGGRVGAALALSGAYMAVLGSSIFSSYFPKVASAINDKAQLNEIFATQVKISLNVALLMMIPLVVFSEFIISLMFSSAFASAAGLLGLLILGDILKLICWPISYVMLADGRGWTNFLIESVAVLVFFIVVMALVESGGIYSFGVGMIARYGVSMGLTLVLVLRFKIIRVEASVFIFMACAVCTVFSLYFSMQKVQGIGYILGAIAFIVWLYVFMERIDGRRFVMAFLRKLRLN